MPKQKHTPMILVDVFDVPETPRDRLERSVVSALRSKITPATIEHLRKEALRAGEPRVFVSRTLGTACIGEMDAETFERFVGRPPVQDDLHRVNCLEAGSPGHRLCGWCDVHEGPRMECGCL